MIAFAAGLTAIAAGWKLLHIPDHGPVTLAYCLGTLAVMAWVAMKVTMWSAGE